MSADCQAMHARVLARLLVGALLLVTLMLAAWQLLGGPRYLWRFSLSALLVAVSAMVACRFLALRPMRALSVLILVGCTFCGGWIGFFSLGTRRSQLEGEGDSLVAALEQHRQRTGRYPATLKESGLSPRWNRFGGWRYEARADGGSYSLRVGEYEEDYFELWRYSTSDRWSWDD